MKKKPGVIALSILYFLVTVTTIGILTYYFQSRSTPATTTQAVGQIIVTDPPISGQPNLQIRTFRVITLTPSPTIPVDSTPVPTLTLPPASDLNIVTPFIGGPTPPAGYYCIDDANASGCDDETAFIVPKGVGGASGTCGTVIEQAHKIVQALPQEIKYQGESPGFPEGKPRDKLSTSITSSCYTEGTGTYANGYLSSYFVIDSYRLAGFPELSKTNPQHVDATQMMNWWKTAPGGYTFLPYSATLMQQFGTGQVDLTGCVMFLRFPSGIFPTIVNKLELYNTFGDGVISALMSNAIFYLDRFTLDAWNIINSEHSAGSSKPDLSGVEGFGCHL